MTTGSSFNEVAGLLKKPAFASTFSVHFSDIYTVPCDIYMSMLLTFQKIGENKQCQFHLERDLKEKEKKIKLTHNAKPILERKTNKKECKDCNPGTIKKKCDDKSKCVSPVTIGDFTGPTQFYWKRRKQIEFLLTGRQKEEDEKEIESITEERKHYKEDNVETIFPKKGTLQENISIKNKVIQAYRTKLRHLNKIETKKKEVEKNIREKKMIEALNNVKQQEMISPEKYEPIRVAQSTLDSIESDARVAHTTIQRLKYNINRNNKLLKDLTKELINQCTE